jgi:galactonate dehydratase
MSDINRRSTIRGLVGTGALLGLDSAIAAEPSPAAPIGPNDNIKVTKVETFVLKNSWVFVKISTDAGITGWGEMLKDDAKACAAGALEVGRYLVGQDPTAWCFTGRRFSAATFYRGGPIKTAIQSGIDQALWDIKGKVYGVPVYKLLGGPTRDRIRVYGTVSSPSTGVNAMKVGSQRLRRDPAFKYVEGQKFVDEVADKRSKPLASGQWPGRRYRHRFPWRGTSRPRRSNSSLKALEPYHPWFYEEVVQCLNVDVMAELAKKDPHPAGHRGTHLH